jgi:hypothetical protein
MAMTAALGLGFSAHAGDNLVSNGNFATTTGGVNGYGQFVPDTSLPYKGKTSYAVTSIADWSTVQNSSNQNSPFLFVVDPTTLDTTGFYDSWDSSTPQLWGSANGGTGVITAPPNGAGPNALLMDADYNISPIYQAIPLADLTVGDEYTISFEWAAGQWQGRYGDTTEGLEIGLGGHVQQVEAINTKTGKNELSNPSLNFSGWMSYTGTFVYNGDDTTIGYAYDEGGQTFTAQPNWLTLIAEGSPSGYPPTVLISGISLVQAAPGTPITPNPGALPEPASWALMIVGIGGLGALVRRRRAQAAAFAAA